MSDSGEGIPPYRIHELFTPFARLGADRGDVEGSGLGFSLSQALAEAMGGRLLLETTSSGGTTFLVEVPAAEGVGRAADAAARPSARPQGDDEERPKPAGEHSILYIEDNLANVELLEDILSRRPRLSLVPSMQGSLGLELARSRKPSLILLDLHLPDISGEEVLAQLKGDRATASIPVVILTADAINAKPEHFLARGARACLTKPIEVGRLMETIDVVLAEVEGR